MRGTAQLNSLQVGRVLSRSTKVIKVIPTKVAPFGNGTIKSNQRWSGPGWVNSAGALGLLWNARSCHACICRYSSMFLPARPVSTVTQA